MQKNLHVTYSLRFDDSVSIISYYLQFVDDWLKRDRFIFIGWSGMLLLPTSYLSVGSWFTGTWFVTSCFTHCLASCYIEGCNFFTAAVSTPSNCMGHSLLLILLHRLVLLSTLLLLRIFRLSLGVCIFLLLQNYLCLR